MEELDWSLDRIAKLSFFIKDPNDYMLEFKSFTEPKDMFTT